MIAVRMPVVLLLGITVALATPSSALMMCKKRSGVVTFRDTCKPSETVVDSADVV
jgi:hypothetical protein